ncbi:secreted protein containing FecR protein domain protein [Candidatus Magnetomorum sp. HK-1]|nr:secreted protein containing FecR protein domain protein [Candidatus Magnetomorum sp. HK-1]
MKTIIFSIKLILFIALCIVTFAFAETVNLPENIVIEKNYKPGFGFSVAKVLIAQGDVFIMHQKIREVYPAKKGINLYKSDTLFCLENSRMSFRCNDGSLLSLGSNTQMVITESIYDASHRKRASFLKMKTGKARFGVTRLSDYNRSDFKVRTPTAIVGVRGSDFIIRAKKLLTEVVTFQDTVLEIVNLFAPDVMPILLSDFEKVVVEAEMLTSVVSPISAEDAEAMKQEFIFEKKQDFTHQTMPTGKHDKFENTSETSTKPIETPTDIILIPEEEIIPIAQTPGTDDIEIVMNDSTNDEIPSNEVSDISQNIHEQNVKSEMPVLPGHPVH